MQVGRNNPLRPRPGRTADGSLDPDLTKVNREGIQYTSGRLQEAQAARRRKLAEQAQAQLESRVGADPQAPKGVTPHEVSAPEASRPAAAEARAGAAGHAPAAESDRIELSEGATRAAAGLPGPEGRAESPADRAERVAELKAAHEAGRLNTPERVDQAAKRLLAGD